MKRTVIVGVLLASLLSFSIQAADIDAASGAKLDITSRTTYGVNLDETYKYGLKNELTKFSLAYHLIGYQPLTNKVTTSDAVGFIQLTLFHLDLEMVGKIMGYNAPAPVNSNRFQTGAFIAGIAQGNWIFQLNASENEKFMAPWNKGLEFVNDRVKFSWSYLDAMVDVRRIEDVDTLLEKEPPVTVAEKIQGPVVEQFSLHTVEGGADSLAMSIPESSTTIAAMYNTDTFGLNLKAATEFAYDASGLTMSNMNGLAFGIDTVVSPVAFKGLRVFTSAAGTYNWGEDDDSDPVMAGMRAGYNVPLNDDVSVEPYAGVDCRTELSNGRTMDFAAYEASAGVTIRWPGRGGWYTDYILNNEGRVFPGMTVGYKIYDDLNDDVEPKHDVRMSLFEEKGDDGIFYGVGAESVVELSDISKVTGDGTTLLATAYVDYTLPGFMKGTGKLIPWTILSYDYLFDDVDQNLKVDAGVKLEDAISNTTLGITWNSGNLLIEGPDPMLGFLKFSVEVRF